jgi:hypothetical protein
MGLHDLMVVFDGDSFAHDDLLLAPNEHEPGVETSNEGLHFVFNPSSSVVLDGFILSLTGVTI